mmetsp:Transcript_51056/g.111242  ORF Transcript_51056/g.111242 Transcript_51056/m.111242 type:complete len:82 (+) Transcript_51056:45-290(+)
MRAFTTPGLLTFATLQTAKLLTVWLTESLSWVHSVDCNQDSWCHGCSRGSSACSLILLLDHGPTEAASPLCTILQNGHTEH